MSRFKQILSDIGLVYSAAIWGSTFFIVKNSLDYIAPLALIAYRFLFASFFLFIYLKVKKVKVFKDYKKGLLLSFILFGVFFPQTVGLKITTASNSGFITGLFIIFVPFISWMFYKKRPPIIKIISVAIAVFGLWILTGGIDQANGGDYLTLITAVFYALHIVAVGKIMNSGTNPYVLTFQQFFGIGLLSLIAAPLVGSSLGWSSGSVIPIIIFLAIFPSLSAFLIQTVVQKYTSPVKVAIIFSFEPLFAAIFSWTIGGEKFFLIKGLGGGMMVIAFILSEFPFARFKKTIEKQYLP